MLNTYRVLWQENYKESLPWDDNPEPSCEIRLKEFGGNDFGDEFLCTLKGNLASCRFCKGDLVVAALRFRLRYRIDGSCYQEIIVADIRKLS